MNAEPQGAPRNRGDDPPTQPSTGEPENPAISRLFLHEPGWRVALKVGSEKAYCYMMNPGENHYHRLLDGEIVVFHGDERLCMACAERRGLISFGAKALREPMLASELGVKPEAYGSEFDLKYRDGDEV